MDFDASLGEVGSTACATMIVDVAIIRTYVTDVVHCTWNSGEVISKKFSVNAQVWFSRSHPRRDALKEGGIIEQVVSLFSKQLY